MTKIQIKEISNQILFPKYETPSSSGMDIAAHIKENIIINSGEKALMPTIISLGIPKGYQVQIRPKSSLAAKKSITVLNSPGTIDANYRDKIKLVSINLGTDKFIVVNGEMISQIFVCPAPQVQLEKVNELFKLIIVLGCLVLLELKSTNYED